VVGVTPNLPDRNRPGVPAVRPTWLIPLACWPGLPAIVWSATAATHTTCRNVLVGALVPGRIHGSEPAVRRAVYTAADLAYRHANYSPDAYGIAYNTARALGAGPARARELAEQAARQRRRPVTFRAAKGPVAPYGGRAFACPHPGHARRHRGRPSGPAGAAARSSAGSVPALGSGRLRAAAQAGGVGICYG
jgi:hypothetical protein